MEGAEEAAAGVGSEASVPLSWLGVRVDAGAPVGLSLWVPPAPDLPAPWFGSGCLPSPVLLRGRVWGRACTPASAELQEELLTTKNLFVVFLAVFFFFFSGSVLSTVYLLLIKKEQLSHCGVRRFIVGVINSYITLVSLFVFGNS